MHIYRQLTPRLQRLLPELLAALVEMSRLLGGPSLGVLQENRAHKFCSRQNVRHHLQGLFLSWCAQRLAAA